MKKKDLAFEAELAISELRVYQVLLLIGAIFIPLWGYLIKYFYPGLVDSFLIRSLFGLLCIATLFGIKTSNVIRQHIHLIMFALCVFSMQIYFYYFIENNGHHYYIVGICLEMAAIMLTPVFDKYGIPFLIYLIVAVSALFSSLNEYTPEALYATLCVVTLIFISAAAKMQRSLYRQALEKKQRMIIEYGENASKTAHDLKGPLSALNVLKSLKLNLTNEQSRLLTNSIERINSLITDQMLSYTEFNRKPFLLSKLVQSLKDSYALFSYSNRITFTYSNDETINCISEINLSRVLCNLIDNAIATGPDTEVSTSFTSKDNMLTVTVTDNGPGIAPGELDSLFTSGKSSKGSSGLGLQNVKELIEKSNGTVEVNSQTSAPRSAELGENKGTKFVIRIPKVEK